LIDKSAGKLGFSKEITTPGSTIATVRSHDPKRRDRRQACKEAAALVRATWIGLADNDSVC
jgi:hypothetical protein